MKDLNDTQLAAILDGLFFNLEDGSFEDEECQQSKDVELLLDKIYQVVSERYPDIRGLPEETDQGILYEFMMLHSPFRGDIWESH